MRTSGRAAHLTRNRTLRRWWAALIAGTLLLAGCTPGGDGGEDSGETGNDSAPPTQQPSSVDVDAGDIEQLWAAPAVRTENPVSTIWLTDTTVATVTSAGVSAYAPDTGEELWHLQPPDGAGDVCWSANAPNGDGVGAVLYTSDGDSEDEAGCSVLAAVDAATGEVLWSRDLTRDWSQALVSGLTVGEEAVAVELGADDGFYRFAVDGGEELPAFEVPHAEECRPYAWRHSTRFTLVVTNCEGAGAHVFDTQSGELRFSIPDPVLLEHLAVVDGDRLAYWQGETLIVHDDDGTVTATITVPDGRFAGTEAIVTDSAVVGMSGSEDSTPRYPDYAGWDLETGRQLWAEELPGGDWYPGLWYPAGDGDRILVDYPASADGGGEQGRRLGWLNPRDGTLADAGGLPETVDLVSDGALVPDRQVVYALTMPGQGLGRVRLVAYELPG